MHTKETMMKRNKFQLQVVTILKTEKMLNMIYDKRQILMPTVLMKDVTVIATSPFGQCDVL